MLLISSSAGTGGILFGAALLLCALLVCAIREIDIKTRARITPPPPAKKEKADEARPRYIVKKKSGSCGKTKQTA